MVRKSKHFSGVKINEICYCCFQKKYFLISERLYISFYCSSWLYVPDTSMHKIYASMYRSKCLFQNRHVSLRF